MARMDHLTEGLKLLTKASEEIDRGFNPTRLAEVAQAHFLANIAFSLGDIADALTRHDDPHG